MYGYHSVIWNSFAFISFICFLLSASSAILSFASRKMGAALLYGLMSLTLAGWSLGLFFCLSATQPEDALFWARTANYIILLLPPLIFHFVSVLVDKRTQLFRYTLAYYLLTLCYLSAVIYAPDHFLYAPSYRLEQFWFPLGGGLFYVFPAVFTLIATHAIRVLRVSRIGANRQQKLKADYMVATIIVGLLGGGLSVSLEFGIDIPPYSILSVGVMVVISTYAVLKHELLELPETISVLAARIMTYICIFAFMVLALEMVGLFGDLPVSNLQTWVVGLIGVMSAEIYAAIKNRIQRFSDRILAKERLDHEKQFRSLMYRLDQVSDVEAMLPELRTYFESQSYVHHYGWYLDQSLLAQSLKQNAHSGAGGASSADALIYQRILFSRNDGRRHDRLPSTLRLDHDQKDHHEKEYGQHVKPSAQLVYLMSSEQLDSAYLWVEKVPGREMIGLPVIGNKGLRGMLLVVVSSEGMSSSQQSAIQSLTTKLAQVVDRIELYRDQVAQQQQFLLDKMNSMQTLAAEIASDMGVPLRSAAQFCTKFSDLNASFDGEDILTRELSAICSRTRLAVNRGMQSIDLLQRVLDNQPVDASGFELLSIQSVVNAALAKYAFLPGERKKIESDLRQGFVLKGDENRLVFVIFILLKNILAEASGSRLLNVYIGSDIEESVNTLTIRVTGGSILDDILLLSSRNLESDDLLASGTKLETNLGLSFCKRMMSAFGGDLVVDSESGQFTQFCLLFPLVASEGQKHEELEQRTPVVAYYMPLTS